MLCYALKGRYWDARRGKKEIDDKDNEKKKRKEEREELPIE